MRTQLLRGVLVLAVALGLSAPAFAQSIVRGSVVDETGKPVPDATVVFEFEGNTSRRAETKTNGDGNFLQVGLPSGTFIVTVTAGNRSATTKIPVRQGENRLTPLRVSPGGGAGAPADDEAAAKIQAAAAAASAALQAGRHDEAIAGFEGLVAQVPTCSDCYYNLGQAYAGKQDWANAETAFKKAIEIKADHAQAYSGLAQIYNAQRRFDDAVAASSKAAELAGAGGVAGGGNAEALYNAGVTLWNAQKYAEAKTQFEAAVKADPKLEMAWYQLAMANLNLGQIPAAKEAFQGYLTNAPTGDKAAEVQAMLKQLP
jgi:cytochrome c-type biogenesis protein CcmH/NrfG